MTLAPVSEVDTSSVKLNTQTVKGMDSWAIESMKDTVWHINNNLNVAGQSLAQVARDLAEIKLNIKPGNWKAFLSSGVLSCTPRFATDLVSAHQNWLAKAEVDDFILAQMTPRTMAAMANASEAERQKVYKLFASADTKTRVTEAAVRAQLRGPSKKKKGEAKSVDERLEKAQATNRNQLALIQKLREENRKLRAAIGNKKEVEEALA